MGHARIAGALDVPEVPGETVRRTMIEIAVTTSEIESRLRELELGAGLGNVQAIELWLENAATAYALALLQELDAESAAEHIAELGTGCRCVVVKKRRTGDLVDTSDCPIHGQAA